MLPAPYWIAVFLGGLAVGAAVVGLLTIDRNKEPLAFLLGVAGVFAGTWGILEIINVYHRADLVVAAVGLSLASLGGGYALASTLVPLLSSRRKSCTLPPDPVHALQLPAVVVIATVEPERYQVSAITSELERLAAAGMPEATIGIMPFLYAAQKARYRAIGGSSPSMKQALAATERLEALLGDSVGSVRFVSCVGRDTLDRSVCELAVNETSTIIVAAISVGESYAIDRAKAATDQLRPGSHGITIAYTPPLWGADRLVESVAERIWTATDTPESTGVALVAHGQPEPWERTHAAFDVQENSFLNRARTLLGEHGIPSSNIKLCFQDWRTPDVTETVRHLAALGCSRILVVPACDPFESATTLIDLQVAVRQARVPEHVTTITLGAWGDDPVIGEVLAEAVRTAQADL